MKAGRYACYTLMAPFVAIAVPTLLVLFALSETAAAIDPKGEVR